MTSARARVLLLGDSHLARLGPDVPALGTAVVNRARGGASSRDLASQVGGVDVDGFDVAVVSVGTNDAAPWKLVPPQEGVARLHAVVTGLPCAVVLLSPPGVDESRLVRSEDRTNARTARHAAALADVVLREGGRVVDSPRLLSPLGRRAFVDDGVHLTPAGYAVLLPAVAQAVAGVVHPERHDAPSP